MTSLIEAENSGPVTIVVTRRVKAGREADYEAWIADIQQETRGFPGYLGVEVIRPSPTGPREYTTVVRFESVAQLRLWERSDVRERWFARIGDFVEGDAEVRQLEGLEFWFAPPGAPAAIVPSRHRMALLIVAVVFAIVSLLGPPVRILLADAPSIVSTLVLILLQVGLMTYLVMPWLTRRLAFWLFPKRAP